MAFEVEYFTLDTTSATVNQAIQLTTGVPSDSSDVALDLIGGTAQAIDADFTVDGTNVSWDYPSSNLYGLTTAGDKMRVIYDRS